ncbi:glycosyltransferase BC10-like [Impatiens glandulifera]|uniref:glycosyltransferase BC10-like n=1 Tax=Impatiens glandulifera TaxID=253017 RepID=UPI001FB0837D|nr:glycosyltransferase BC10-like [Impatiens glandulifera]
MEEGKNNNVSPPFLRINPSKILPLRILQFLLLLLAIGISFSFLSMFMIRYVGSSQITISSFTTPNSSSLPCFMKSPSSPSLMHDMNETELFWRASMVPLINQYPFARTKKIAFMFLTIGSLPMAPLWERFFNGHHKLYSIYIHSSPSYQHNFNSSSVFYKRKIPSQTVEWGTMSMCDAERRLLANALLDVSNEWFILLSESCIPIQNFSSVYESLSRSNLSFMGSFDDPGASGRGRYSWNMRPEVDISQWRKGSQWFEVERRLAVHIISDSIYYRKFKEFCTPSCYVDEHYFQTMMSIQFPHLLANRTLTWVDWSRGGAHPATFGKEDITAKLFEWILEDHGCDLVGGLCFLFARKFAPDALEPLLQISSEVFGF